MQQDYFDLDLERAILSSCIMSDEVYASIAGDIGVNDFSLKAHQDIFKAIVACANENEPISLSFLRKHKKLNEEVLSEIIATPSIGSTDPIARSISPLRTPGSSDESCPSFTVICTCGSACLNPSAT